ncbi:MAG: oxidoreductase, partial [Tolypothrix sp. Co-bin9]|nr:oxidoreductase [Tolypothrix sp. Co-bin9]
MPNQFSNPTLSTQTSNSLFTLTIAPAKVIRGAGALISCGEAIARLGTRPLILGGDRTLAIIETHLQPILQQLQVDIAS